MRIVIPGVGCLLLAWLVLTLALGLVATPAGTEAEFDGRARERHELPGSLHEAVLGSDAQDLVDGSGQSSSLSFRRIWHGGGSFGTGLTRLAREIATADTSPLFSVV